jgi:hypothetical protein
MRKLVSIITRLTVISVLGLELVFLNGCIKDDDGRECISITADPSSLVKLSAVYKGFLDGSLFQNSPISIPPYGYDDTVHVQLKGDVVIQQMAGVNNLSPCDLQQLLDRTTNEPSLAWTNTGDELVAAAIFKNRIRLDAKNTLIQNEEAAVWGWHSGLGTGGVEAGNKYVVDFRDGRMVKHGLIMETEMARPLKYDSVYYWLVWVWDENGTKIIKSSREIPILVTKDAALPSINVSHVSQLMGTWNLVSAVDLNSGENVTDQFYLRKMEIRNGDCKAPVKFTDLSGAVRADSLRYNGLGFDLDKEEDLHIAGARINCAGLDVELTNTESTYQLFFKK